MRRLLTTAAILILAFTGPSYANGTSCLSRMVVNISDTYPALLKAKPKVMSKIKKDLNEVLASINSDDRDDKIRALLDTANDMTGTILNQTSNNDIDAAVTLTANATVNTVAFIEKNANNPSSRSITDSKKQQVIAAIDQVILAHVSCND